MPPTARGMRIQPTFGCAAYGAIASTAACQLSGMIGAVMPYTRQRPGKVCIRRSGVYSELRRQCGVTARLPGFVLVPPGDARSPGTAEPDGRQRYRAPDAARRRVRAGRPARAPRSR